MVLRPWVWMGWLHIALGGAWAQAASDARWADLYARTCSSCHQGGGGGAPRLDQPLEWTQRLSKGVQGLTAAALRGVPNTAMLPKGGYALSDEQVGGLVDWMVRQVQATPPLTSPVAAAARSTHSPSGALGAPTTVEWAEQLALGLRAHLGDPSQAIEAVESQTWLVRGLGIRIQVRVGVVTLSGTVEASTTVEQAGAWAARQPGVGQVINRLVAASLFEWD
jgi:cytochrome c5